MTCSGDHREVEFLEFLAVSVLDAVEAFGDFEDDEHTRVKAIPEIVATCLVSRFIRAVASSTRKGSPVRAGTLRPRAGTNSGSAAPSRPAYAVA